jgi:hypothetical protein
MGSDLFFTVSSRSCCAIGTLCTNKHDHALTHMSKYPGLVLTGMSQKQDANTKHLGDSAAWTKACPSQRDDDRQIDAGVAAVAAGSFQNAPRGGRDGLRGRNISDEVEAAIAQMTQDGGSQLTQAPIDACRMLCKLACNAEHSMMIADKGGIQALLRVVGTRCNKAHAQAMACAALCNMGAHPASSTNIEALQPWHRLCIYKQPDAQKTWCSERVQPFAILRWIRQAKMQ